MPWDGQQSGAASVRAYSYMAGTQDEVNDQEQQQAAACDSWPQQHEATGGLVC